jgi:uncharacterized protein (DUF302 family)
MSYGTTVTLDISFDDAVARVRTALSEQGFGVLTEIDVRATMKAKLGVEMDDYVILGACNPPLAHQALGVDPSVGLLLPCNVVVRRSGESSVVDVLDPQVMVRLSDEQKLKPVADEASQRLAAMVTALAEPPRPGVE